MTKPRSKIPFAPVAACFTLSATTVLSASETRGWRHLQPTGLNNLPSQTTMVIWPDLASTENIGPASNAERMKSPFYRSLNGDWK